MHVNDTAPYPDAMVGYTRYAIHLPSIADENKARVEILIGKEMNADCNTRSLGGINNTNVKTPASGILVIIKLIPPIRARVIAVTTTPSATARIDCPASVTVMAPYCLDKRLANK